MVHKLVKRRRKRLTDIKKTDTSNQFSTKKSIKKQITFVLPIIKSGEKTLKFDIIKVDKKGFHKSKQPMNLEFRI